jgi:hypothetical protein
MENKQDSFSIELIRLCWLLLSSLNNRLPSEKIRTTFPPGLTKKIFRAGQSLGQPSFILLGSIANKSLVIESGSLSTNILSTNLSNEYSHENRLRNAFGLRSIDCLATSEPRSRLLPYQSTILESGNILLDCPFGTGVLSSEKSFFCQAGMYPFILYRFESRQPFFLITGGWSGGKLGYYFPLEELVLAQTPALQPSFQNSLLQFKLNYFCSADEVLRYLSQTTNSIGVATSYSKHFGHSLLADFTGLISLASECHNYEVSRLYVGPSSVIDVMSCFKECFPKDKFKQVSSSDLFHSAISNNEMLIRPTRLNKFCRASSEYLISYSLRSERSKQLSSFIEEAAVRTSVWIGVRTTRTIIDQEQVLVDLYNSLSRLLPDIYFVLDGRTRIHSPDSDKSSNTYNENEHAIIDEIQNSIGRGNSLSVSGWSISEKILIAKACSYYVIPFGSTYLIPLSCNLPGIITAHHAVASMGKIENEISAYFGWLSHAPMVVSQNNSGARDTEEPTIYRTPSEALVDHGGSYELSASTLFSACKKLMSKISLI